MPSPSKAKVFTVTESDDLTFEIIRLVRNRTTNPRDAMHALAMALYTLGVVVTADRLDGDLSSLKTGAFTRIDKSEEEGGA